MRTPKVQTRPSNTPVAIEIKILASLLPPWINLNTKGPVKEAKMAKKRVQKKKTFRSPEPNQRFNARYKTANPMETVIIEKKGMILTTQVGFLWD